MSTEIISKIFKDLSSDKIDYKVAFSTLKSLPKPWTTKEWKNKRDNIIKNECAVCNSNKGPFVLQHTKQPQEFPKLYDEIAQKELMASIPDYEKVHSEKIEDAINYEIQTNFEMRDSCPNCKVVNIRIRKTMTPKYVCVNNHSFELPLILKYYRKSQTTNLEIVRKKGLEILPEIIAYKMRREFSEKNDLAIGKKALLISLSESLEYWSFDNTKTACKKCSYLEDQYRIYTKNIPYYYR